MGNVLSEAEFFNTIEPAIDAYARAASAGDPNSGEAHWAAGWYDPKYRDAQKKMWWDLYNKDPASFAQRMASGTSIEQGVLKSIDPSRQGLFTGQGGSPAGGDPQAGQPTDADLMRAFSLHMMDPRSMDVNDPYVARVLKLAGGAAQDDAALRGLNGGYATGNVARAATNAATDLQFQRQQLGMQGLQGAGALTLGQYKAQADAYNQQWQSQAMQAQQKYAHDMDQNQSIWGTVGGIGTGLVAGYATGWNPAAMQAGFQTGSKVVAGIAGAGTTPPSNMPYTPPAFGGRRGSY